VFSYDPISATAELRKKLTNQKKHMERLAGLDFYLEYQPQVTPHNQKLVGVEALIRAKDAEKKIWGAGEFLPWFEDASMMKSIDLWVATEAIKQDAEWQNLGLNIGIKINVSSETLKHRETMDLLIEKLAIAHGRVSIEIVEQEFFGELESVVESIRRIQAIGAKVYIDDFGTGYSSLSYLNSLKVDCIKVDRNFVLELEKPEGQKVMAGIFNFAETLGLELIVEGVETEEQLAKIPQHPLFAVQGWLYSKSLNPLEIPAFAAKFNHPVTA
jgi:EAL domain-containing protein (putative c-di-GMP-specific phosphodiesterase class I)